MFREFTYKGVRVTITGPHSMDDPAGREDRTTPVGEWYDVVSDEITLGHFRTGKEEDGGLTVRDVISASELLDHDDLVNIARLVATYGLV